MKKVVLMLFAVAIASVNIKAQEPIDKKAASQKSPEERAENMTKRMTKELSLTADQQPKVKALILKREQERDQKVKGKEKREEMDAEWKAILTPEQYQKFQEKRAEGKEKHQEKKKGAANDPSHEPPPQN